MGKVTTKSCEDQINQILSTLDWKEISKTTDESDVPNTTRRVFQSGIFQAYVYTDDKDENFVSIKFFLQQSCNDCPEE